MSAGQGFLFYAAQICLALLIVAMGLVLWRLARGPTAPDRVIALDLLTVLVLAFMVATSIFTKETTYLDVAIAFACITFLGTIALARFIERSTRRQAVAPAAGKPGQDSGGQAND